MKDKIIETIAKVLDVPTSEITDETEIGEPDEWDSLRNVQIFASLQEAFSVKITQDMLVDLENVADIVDLIESLK
jgi:acyl carrier protein